MSIRHVNNFIRVYERFGDRNPGTDLPASITVLNLLTSFTDEQLEQEYELPDGTRKKSVDMKRARTVEINGRVMSSGNMLLNITIMLQMRFDKHILADLIAI